MTRARQKSGQISRFLKTVPVAVLVLWGCLWLNLNTGFWNIAPPANLDQLAYLIRSLLAFVVLPVGALTVFDAGKKLRLPALSPSRMLLIYGLVAIMASAFSPDPWIAFYWGVAFLATIFAAWTFACVDTPVTVSRLMLQVTWAVTFVVAVIIAYTGRVAIFHERESAYWMIHEAEKGLVISSGVARWAAVPGLVCLLRIYHTRRPLLIGFYLGGAATAGYIIYRMQSRGAIFGAAAAILFAVVAANRLRKYALPFLIFGALVMLIIEPSGEVSSSVGTYLRRGQTEEQFRSMSGRTRAYKLAMDAFKDAPFLGRGNWADRMIIGEHSHNSYIQALLNAGIIGFIPYVGSWLAGWILFFRLLQQENKLLPEDRTSLMEAGTVMAFFTVRAIPETTTASYSVDLLVMAAVYVFLESLTVALAGIQRPLKRRPVMRSWRGEEEAGLPAWQQPQAGGGNE
jgi:O-antigen ligase